jgi:hypothetical protein
MGNRPIADSDLFTSDPRIEARSLFEFDELLARLRADGWELTGERGGHWYSVRLRRPLPFHTNGSSAKPSPEERDAAEREGVA